MTDASIIHLTPGLSTASDAVLDAPDNILDSRDDVEITDAALVAAHISGDGTAFARLTERYTPRIYRFTYRMVGQPQDAEDITQETFVKVWRYSKRYRSNERFQAWIFKIARNTAIDWMRKRKQLVFSDFESAEGDNVLMLTTRDPEPLPDALVAKAQDAALLERVIQKLPAPQREVLLLHYHEYLSFNEIGHILDKPLDTVKSRHYRALLLLKKLLADEPK